MSRLDPEDFREVRAELGADLEGQADGELTDADLDAAAAVIDRQVVVDGGRLAFMRQLAARFGSDDEISGADLVQEIGRFFETEEAATDPESVGAPGPAGPEVDIADPALVDGLEAVLAAAVELGGEAGAAEERFNRRRGDRAQEIVDAIEPVMGRLVEVIDSLSERLAAMESMRDQLGEIADNAEQVVNGSADYPDVERDEKEGARYEISSALECLEQAAESDWDEGWVEAFRAELEDLDKF